MHPQGGAPLAAEEHINGPLTRRRPCSAHRRLGLAIAFSTVLLLVIAALFGYKQVKVYVAGNGTLVTRDSLFGIPLQSSSISCRAHDELVSLGIAQPTPECGIDVKRGVLGSHRTPSGQNLRLMSTCDTLVISPGYAALGRDERITLWRQIFDRAQKMEEIDDLVAKIFEAPASDP